MTVHNHPFSRNRRSTFGEWIIQASPIYWTYVHLLCLFLVSSSVSFTPSVFSQESPALSSSDVEQITKKPAIQEQDLLQEKELEEPPKSLSEPIAVYLSWAKSPETTMIISWITNKEEKEQSVDSEHAIRLQKVIEKNPKLEGELQNKIPNEKAADSEQTDDESSTKTLPSWVIHKACTLPFPEENPYYVHSVHLENLTENSLYLFEIVGTKISHTFRTSPKKLSSPLTFIIGGDTYQADEYFREMNMLASQYNPLFAVMGGDLAYATPSNKKKLEDCDKWLSWLKSWYETMRSNDSGSDLPLRLIPMVVAIGNHEVKGRYGQTEKEALFFFTLFRKPFLDKSYYLLRFSDYLSLYILDSGHTATISGEQKNWLMSEMKKDLLVYHKIASYHVPAYPSVRYYRNGMSSQIRRHWVPIFDKQRLHLAFENHDHAYKRTFPLRDSEIHPRGVVYIGDGSWGTKERLPKKANRTSYLAKTAKARQLCIVRLSYESREVIALASPGREIDRYEEDIDDILMKKAK